MVDFSELASLDWTAPEGLPRPVQLASLVLAAISSLLIAWLLDDSRADLAMAKQQLGQVMARHERLQAQSSQISDLQAQAQVLKFNISEVSQQYLRPDELPDLLHLFSTLSVEHEAELATLEVGSVRQLGRFEVQPSKLVVGGTYHNIGRLHASIARWPWLTIVEAFEVSAQESDDTRLEMRVRIILPLIIEEAAQ